MEKEKIAVIGAGAWGTTLANYLAKRDHPVSLWAYEPEVCEAIRSRRENPQFLPGVSLHPGISPTNRLSEAAQGASLILSAVPSQVVRSLWQTLSAHLASSTDAVSVSKGLETSSLLTMTQVIREAVPDSVALRLAALSGPTFASEVSQGYPTAGRRGLQGARPRPKSTNAPVRSFLAPLHPRRCPRGGAGRGVEERHGPWSRDFRRAWPWL